MISHQTLQIQVFKKEHIPEYLDYAYYSYSQGNPEYAGWGLTKQAFDAQTQIILQRFIQSAEQVNKLRGTQTPFNTFLRIDGKMAVACFSCEVHLFFKLFKEGKVPESQYQYLLPNVLQQNQAYSAVLTTRHAVNKLFFQKGLYTLHSQMRSKLFLRDGYHYEVGLLNNPVNLSFYKKRGAELEPIRLDRGQKVRVIHMFRVAFTKVLEGFV